MYKTLFQKQISIRTVNGSIYKKFLHIFFLSGVNLCFDKILKSYSINNSEIIEIKKNLKTKVNLNKLTTKQIIKFSLDITNNKIQEFTFQISSTEKILLKRNSNNDGFDQEILELIYDKIKVPFIIHGGAGNEKQIYNILKYDKVSGVAISSLLHYSLIREKNFNRQNKYFSKHNEFFSTPEQTKNTKTGWLAYPILINKNTNFKRKDFQIYLEKRDIQTRVVFTGNIIRQPMMKSVNYRINKGGYPNSDAVMERGVLLPLHHGMTDEMFERLHSEIDNFLSQI